ncbi:MAG: protein adenylyltransferase SelO family protein, partial [Pseudomonadota bacterium]
MRTLETLNFDNRYGRLPGGFYSRLEPTPLPDPRLVSFNPAVAQLIDLDPAEARRETFVAAMAGNTPLPGADPLAMLYAGHQFGHYVPQLGDGRAILLGEVVNSHDERWTLQLKGAGVTPYSRGADGRAVLRSTIREYLCSEAMHGLGIPTTRALCIVGADQPVFRESVETAAVLLRLAPSHVRFGSFEVFYYRKQREQLKLLADHVIEEHFPELEVIADSYPRFLAEVIARTARLIARWQAVGFAHGVMNTDNMSILGLTLDYGP